METWQSAFVDVFRRKGFELADPPVCLKDSLRMNIDSQIGRLVLRVDLEPSPVMKDQLFVKRGKSLRARRMSEGSMDPQRFALQCVHRSDLHL